ncbi:HlyC/CorC family transporter [Rickettsia endosymbiont of Polydrusus tereticollis]|uniref:HlyC/CorC family transporter n=1 Tax=Rickettsia endosymbiont of Polydrusus tereticollis TaxID=3066251 RepID=UPI0031330F8E|nr:HlyC/CorC family transporter [Rickettsia endosymbiont of Oxypoda opaca]
MTTLLVIIIIIMMGISALLAATETAITASSPGKIQKLKIEGNKRATLVLEVLKKKEKVIGTLLIGNSLINTVCTTIATSLFISFLGHSGTIVASAVMAFIIIVFGEVVPKAIAVAKAEQLALFMAPTIIVFLKILKPINATLDYIIKIFCFIFRINLKSQISGTEEVRGVIEHYHQEGNVYKSDRNMLGGILDIRNMVVSEIMTHRSNIIAINIDLPNEVIVKNALALSSNTRVPLWQDNRDNIIGILHLKDLLRALYDNNNDAKKINIKELVTPPWFIPENALVVHQLHAFRERNNHFACVVDEYGDLQGIITLEDILEEIVGPITDEHDRHNNEIIKQSDSEFIINGTTTIRDINRELDWNLPDNNANTIAGLIIHKIARIPSQGEVIEIFNLTIVINRKIANKIESVKITVLPATEGIINGE